MGLSQHITEHGLPHNFITAIQTLNETGDLGEVEYNKRICEVLDKDDVSISEKYARHTYLYLIQEGIKNGVADLAVAEQKARKFVDANPWCLRSDPDGETKPRKLDAAGNPKKKKGAKKEMAIGFYNKHRAETWTRKQWIEQLVQHVGLTAAGASTYYANLKAGRYK